MYQRASILKQEFLQFLSAILSWSILYISSTKYSERTRNGMPEKQGTSTPVHFLMATLDFQPRLSSNNKKKIYLIQGMSTVNCVRCPFILY